MLRIYLAAVEESNFLHSCEVKFARNETLYECRENLTKNEALVLGLFLCTFLWLDALMGSFPSTDHKCMK